MGGESRVVLREEAGSGTFREGIKVRREAAEGKYAGKSSLKQVGSSSAGRTRGTDRYATLRVARGLSQIARLIG